MPSRADPGKRRCMLRPTGAAGDDGRVIATVRRMPGRWLPALPRAGRKACGLVWIACMLPAALHAAIRIAPGPDGPFAHQVETALSGLRASDRTPWRRLVESVDRCPATVEIRPMTADRRTWHPDGNPQRGHTDPTDRRPKRLGRDRPTDAWLYVPPSAVQPGSRLWRSGVLVHELTHAMDLVCGRYHPQGSVRERRAVWVQNLWRQANGHALRTSYHGRFPTPDFQTSSIEGRLAEYEERLFSGSDFPPPANLGGGRRRLSR